MARTSTNFDVNIDSVKLGMDDSSNNGDMFFSNSRDNLEKTKIINRNSVPIDSLVEAPNDWNFFHKYNGNEMERIVESILEVGLLNPIIVWQKTINTNNPEYIILSGHNRVKAYELLRKNSDDPDKYSRIDAIIKGPNEIDENMAMQIIIDTNWAQRVLTTSEKAKSIARKYILLRKANKGNGEGNTFSAIDILADEYKLKERQITDYKHLASLIDEIAELLDNSEISIKVGVRISKCSPEIQRYIYTKWLLNENTRKVFCKNYRKLNSDMTCNDIDFIMEEAGAINVDEPQLYGYEAIYPGVGDINKKFIVICEAEDKKYIKEAIEKLFDESSEMYCKELESKKIINIAKTAWK